MEYNTSRNQIIVPEYGRNVQKIVEYALSLTDREERNTLARYIVRMMTNINASAGNIHANNEQMIWDHLFIISNFELDVDAPYPMPDKEKIQITPKPLAYANGQPKFRTYGRNIEKIIEVAVAMPEGEEKHELIKIIAFNLKKSYLSWNQKTVNDEQIRKDLERMSDGKLSLPEDYELPSANDILAKRNNRTYNKNTPKYNKKKKVNYKSK